MVLFSFKVISKKGLFILCIFCCTIRIWNPFFAVEPINTFFGSVGRGDSSHLVTRGDSSHSPFRGEKTWKSKNGYYHSKEQVIISKWPRFQPDSAYVSILPKFPKKVNFFYPREIWLEPKSNFCSIYHNFVINPSLKVWQCSRSLPLKLW